MPANPWVTDMSSMRFPKGPSTLATLFSHMWPRIVAGIFIPAGNHYFQALASTLQFVAQVCDRLWLVPATDRAFAYITYKSPPHVALVCSGPPQKRGHMWLNKVASSPNSSFCWPGPHPQKASRPSCSERCRERVPQQLPLPQELVSSRILICFYQFRNNLCRVNVFFCGR